MKSQTSVNTLIKKFSELSNKSFNTSKANYKLKDKPQKRINDKDSEAKNTIERLHSFISLQLKPINSNNDAQLDKLNIANTKENVELSQKQKNLFSKFTLTTTDKMKEILVELKGYLNMKPKKILSNDEINKISTKLNKLIDETEKMMHDLKSLQSNDMGFESISTTLSGISAGFELIERAANCLLVENDPKRDQINIEIAKLLKLLPITATGLSSIDQTLLETKQNNNSNNTERILKLMKAQINSISEYNNETEKKAYTSKPLKSPATTTFDLDNALNEKNSIDEDKVNRVMKLIKKKLDENLDNEINDDQTKYWSPKLQSSANLFSLFDLFLQNILGIKLDNEEKAVKILQLMKEQLNKVPDLSKNSIENKVELGEYKEYESLPLKSEDLKSNDDNKISRILNLMKKNLKNYKQPVDNSQISKNNNKLDENVSNKQLLETQLNEDKQENDEIPIESTKSLKVSSKLKSGLNLSTQQLQSTENTEKIEKILHLMKSRINGNSKLIKDETDNNTTENSDQKGEINSSIVKQDDITEPSQNTTSIFNKFTQILIKSKSIDDKKISRIFRLMKQQLNKNVELTDDHNNGNNHDDNVEQIVKTSISSPIEQTQNHSNEPLEASKTYQASQDTTSCFKIMAQRFFQKNPDEDKTAKILCRIKERLNEKNEEKVEIISQANSGIINYHTNSMLNLNNSSSGLLKAVSKVDSFNKKQSDDNQNFDDFQLSQSALDGILFPFESDSFTRTTEDSLKKIIKINHTLETTKAEEESSNSTEVSNNKSIIKNISHPFETNNYDSYTVFEIYDDKIISKTKYINSDNKEESNVILQYQINLS